MAHVAFNVEAIQLVRREQIQERIVEEVIEVLVSRVMEKIIEVVKQIPQERVQGNTVQQSAAVLVPRFPGETGG